eukprot:gnl/TRDRNA2_/TRDRNA2_172590_c1_seq2.p1 gnl/TRDRNA2_/TRDRNA2_172590_c1~~gnl/TRDRNA2_/TRDRNA2_172590_c1_seq2.p1  ORF type:complete len:136 (-),score=19.38 gnl/TRDRNA2_/TRDRNA2_172590_c1_seq2:44-451(-)
MRNNAPGVWREWRWEQLVVPLYVPDPKQKVPDHVKPFSEVTHMTIRALGNKGSLPALRDSINELMSAPDSPGGRISEDRFRNMLHECATTNLDKEEVDVIFPPPPEPESKEGSRRGSKAVTRRGSKDKLTVSEGQ